MQKVLNFNCNDHISLSEVSQRLGCAISKIRAFSETTTRTKQKKHFLHIFTAHGTIASHHTDCSFSVAELEQRELCFSKPKSVTPQRQHHAASCCTVHTERIWNALDAIVATDKMRREKISSLSERMQGWLCAWKSCPRTARARTHTKLNLQRTHSVHA